MLRIFFREALLTTFGLFLVSVVAFTLLDHLGTQDWFSTAPYASALRLPAARITGRDLPLFWRSTVEDARDLTLRDLGRLDDARTRPAALRDLQRRGTAGLPTIMARFPWLSPDARVHVFEVLSRWSPTLTGGETAPVPATPGDDHDVTAWWDRYYAAHLLDFRPGYAQRQAQRLATRESRNASERLVRMGTYGLPALVQTLSASPTRDARVRLTDMLANITGVPWRVRPEAREREASHVVEGWEAFWLSEHLEYQTLPAWQKALGHVTEARYGRWLVRAFRGQFGVSRVTVRPIAQELRVRLPLSALTSGLAGLFAFAGVLAFGGSKAVRQRPLRTRLFDLGGALVPGLTALAFAWALLMQLCFPLGTVWGEAGRLLGNWQWLRVLLSTVAAAALASWWLSRPGFAPVLQAVRIEAERWVEESLTPTTGEVFRHGVRLGVASLLAPMGLAAPTVLTASLVVELLFGLRGMGQLTVQSIALADAPWLMVAILTIVPLLLARRWSLGLLGWLLGFGSDGRQRISRISIVTPAPPTPTPPPADE